MDNSKYAVFPVAVAKDMLAAYRRLMASGLLGGDIVESLIKRIPRLTETPVFFRNDSGYECPPYACMQVIGTVEHGGQNYCKIDKPADVDAVSGEYIFNGHHAVPDGEFGTSQGGRLVRGIKASGTAVAGENWCPVVDAWTIEMVDGGRFVMAGDDDIATDVARVFFSGGSGGGGGGSIEYQIISTSVASSGPYTGLTIASVTIRGAPCDRGSLIDTVVDVVDHSGCIFDLTSAQLVDVWGWASERVFLSLDVDAEEGDLTPCHWSADNRCCVDV